MTPEQMWQAVAENDVKFDGVFFYAVSSTGIFCRPSCRSKIPKRDNIRFFTTAEQAQAAGFRPCKRCRSDLPDFRPAAELTARAKLLIDDMFQAGERLDGELRRLGVSRRRMNELFKRQYGVTPLAYQNGLRLEQAKKLLAESEDAIIDIAYSTGFGSLPSFYRFFRDASGTTPAAYRRGNRKP